MVLWEALRDAGVREEWFYILNTVMGYDEHFQGPWNIPRHARLVFYERVLARLRELGEPVPVLLEDAS
jgi:hypothetical protein